MRDRFEKAVCDTVRRYALFSDGEPLLIGVSGGADSVSMLLCIRKVFPASPITVCHLNHGLRGEEAARDEAFVKELCEKLGVACVTKTEDVAAYAEKTKQSVETAAREVRYAFFAAICRERGIHKVATAHTASDNAETVLFNLIRGSCVQGLCGIPPRRMIGSGIEVVRPLIGVTREETEAYLAAHNQPYVTDSSNLSDAYTRNHIRHNLLPPIRAINPSFERTVSGNADSLRDIEACLTRLAAESMTDSIDVLCGLDKAICTRVIASLCRTQTTCCPLENTHINAIFDALDAAKHEPARRIELCLPGGYSAILHQGTLYFTETIRNTEKTDTDYEMPLAEGFNDLRKVGYAVVLADGADMIHTPRAPQGAELIGSCVLAKDAVCGTLAARSRRDGDIIRLGGQTKKVKRLLNGAKIPAEVRGTLPIIADRSGIVFIPPSFLCDDHKNAVCGAGKTVRVLIYRYTDEP